MRIKDICNTCGATKKAVEYYEKQGLLHPIAEENGYRVYSESDVASLKEITLLRRIGIGTHDIARILNNPDKKGELSRCRLQLSMEAEKTQTRIACLDSLLIHYDVEQASQLLDEAADVSVSIRQKLLDAFPGSYGLYMCVHFGSFLNEPIVSQEQKKAFSDIVAFLDNVENTEFPPDLESYFSTVFFQLGEEDLSSLHNAMVNAYENPNDYFDQNKEAIDSYLQFLATEDAGSPLMQLRKAMRDFHRQTGYYDVFLPNMKVLSPSYRDYCEKLENANGELLKHFPDAEQIFNSIRE